MADRSSRPSPSQSATLFSVGERRKGNDGNWWVIKLTPKGVRRWVRDTNAIPINPTPASAPKQPIKKTFRFSFGDGHSFFVYSDNRFDLIGTFDILKSEISQQDILELQSLANRLPYIDGFEIKNLYTNESFYEVNIILKGLWDVDEYKTLENFLDDFFDKLWNAKKVVEESESTTDKPILAVFFGLSENRFVGKVVDIDNTKTNSQVEELQWYILENEDGIKKSYPRNEFFVDGDLLYNDWNFSKDSNITKITEIKSDNDQDTISYIDLNTKNEKNDVLTSTYFSLSTFTISDYYQLQEKFKAPVLVEKPKSKNNVDADIEKKIETLNKEVAELVFIRSVLSPLDFEKKIEIGNSIKEKQEELNKLNFELLERRLGSRDVFEELFEQSFTPLKHDYTEVYAPIQEEGDYFAPDGAKSQLNDELNMMIRTPEFKQWFGDWQLAYLYRDSDNIDVECSKVISDNYEPMVVWHGTGAEFSYFKFEKFPASYFAKRKAYSEWFANLHGGDDGFVLPFFLNIRNPLDLRHFGTKKITPKDFFDYLYLATGLSMDMLELNPIFMDKTFPPNETWVYLRSNAKMLKKLSESQLHDGIMFYETNPSVPLGEDAHSTEAYIIFNANQVKLASENRGLLLLASLKSFLLKNGGKI